MPPDGSTSQGRTSLTNKSSSSLWPPESVDGLVVRLLAYTGLRWGELAALTVGSVDMLRRRMQIAQAVAEADGRLEWKSPKDHERRSVPFPAFLADELGKQMLGKGREDLLF